MQRFHAGHERHRPAEDDLRAEGAHLLGVAVTAGENIFDEYCRLRAPEGRRHQQRRCVRREAGIGSRDDRAGRGRAAVRRHMYALSVRAHGAAHRAQRVEHRGKLSGRRAGELDLAAGARCAAEIRCRGDAVGRDAKPRMIARGKPGDPDNGRTGTRNFRAKRAEIALQRFDLRLAGGVINDSRSLRRARGDHGVFRGANARQRERNFRAAKVRGAAHDAVLALLDLRAEQPQGVQMEIDRPRAKLAAAGKRYLRLAEAGEQRAEKDHGGAHPVHQLARNVAPRGRSRIDGERIAAASRGAAEIAENVHRRVNVAQIRTVEQLRFRAAEKRRRDHRQNRVFRALYADLPAKRRSAGYMPYTHSSSPAQHFQAILCRGSAVCQITPRRRERERWT